MPKGLLNKLALVCVALILAATLVAALSSSQGRGLRVGSQRVVAPIAEMGSCPFAKQVSGESCCPADKGLAAAASKGDKAVCPLKASGECCQDEAAGAKSAEQSCPAMAADKAPAHGKPVSSKAARGSNDSTL